MLTIFVKKEAMAKKGKSNRIVFSTNPNFEPEQEEEQETIAANQQMLEVHLDRKNRAGKIATVIKGFIGTSDDLNALGKELKSACGVGGSAKDGEIIIQGEKRDRIIWILLKKGFKVKRVGG